MLFQYIFFFLIFQVENQLEVPHDDETTTQEYSQSSRSSLQPSTFCQPLNKKPRATGPIARQNELLQKACSFLDSHSQNEIPAIARAWGEKLGSLSANQRIFAEKAINDILFEASMGTLHRHSVKINEDSPPLGSYPHHSNHTVQPPAPSPISTTSGASSSNTTYYDNFSDHNSNPLADYFSNANF